MSRIRLLPNRALVRITGDSAFEFVQNLYTNNVTRLLEEEGRSCLYGAFLSSKGRVLFDAFSLPWMASDSDVPAVLLDLEAGYLDTALEHFEQYNLEDLEITQVEDVRVGWSIAASGETVAASPSSTVCTDPRPPLRTLGLTRHYQRLTAGSNSVPQSEVEQQHSLFAYALRLAQQGIAEGSDIFTTEKTLPFEGNLDLLDGVHFNKGCYLGQELTHRTHVMLVTRKRLLPVHWDGQCAPEAWNSFNQVDTDVTALKSGKAIGKVKVAQSTLGLPKDVYESDPAKKVCLASIRLSNLEEATLTAAVKLAEGVTGVVKIPSWFPEDEVQKIRAQTANPNSRDREE
jgi:folate-binding protein YgfZ